MTRHSIFNEISDSNEPTTFSQNSETTHHIESDGGAHEVDLNDNNIPSSSTNATPEFKKSFVSNGYEYNHATWVISLVNIDTSLVTGFWLNPGGHSVIIVEGFKKLDDGKYEELIGCYDLNYDEQSKNLTTIEIRTYENDEFTLEYRNNYANAWAHQKYSFQVHPDDAQTMIEDIHYQQDHLVKAKSKGGITQKRKFQEKKFENEARVIKFIDEWKSNSKDYPYYDVNIIYLLYSKENDAWYFCGRRSSDHEYIDDRLSSIVQEGDLISGGTKDKKDIFKEKIGDHLGPEIRERYYDGDYFAMIQFLLKHDETINCTRWCANKLKKAKIHLINDKKPKQCRIS